MFETTPTRTDDLNPGDRVKWFPAPGGIAEVAHIVIPTDEWAGPNSRVVEFTFGGSVRCNAEGDLFSKVVDPTDATPWLVEITVHREGQPVDPVNHTDAEEAASLISDYPELTEVIDPEASLWNVWLPNRLTERVWETGIYLDLIVGGYRFRMDLDPA